MAKKKIKRKMVSRRRRTTAKPQQQNNQPSQVEQVEQTNVEQRPEVILLRWISTYCQLASGEKLNVNRCLLPGQMDDKTFLETTNISEIVDRITFSHVIVSVIKKAAYCGSFRNPYLVVKAMEYCGSIFERIKHYFDQNVPEQWDMAFCELMAACPYGYPFDRHCEWRRSQREARIMFKRFVQGQVSPILHSDRLYAFFYNLFFGYGSTTSFILTKTVGLYVDGQAKFMQGLIEMGKKGVFIWDFETYIYAQQQMNSDECHVSG